MKKELWFLMDRKIGYSEWSGLIKDVTDASDWSKRFNFYISGLLPIFSEFSRFSELKKRHPQKICGWEIFFKHRQFPSKSEWIIVNWSKREIWVQTAGIFSFYIIDFTIGNHQNHQKLYFLLKSKLFQSKVPQFLQIDLHWSRNHLKMTLKWPWKQFRSRKVIFLDRSQLGSR